MVLTGLKFFALACLALVLVIGAGMFVINSEISALKQQVETSEGHRLIKNQKRQIVGQLEQEIALLEFRAQTREHLLGGTKAGLIMLILDRVLDRDVWLKKLSYERGEIPDDESAPEKVTGRSGSGRRIDIKGQSMGHSQLADLVRKLTAEPEIKDVAVLRTSRVNIASVDVLDFDLIVWLRN